MESLAPTGPSTVRSFFPMPPAKPSAQKYIIPHPPFTKLDKPQVESLAPTGPAVPRMEALPKDSLPTLDFYASKPLPKSARSEDFLRYAAKVEKNDPPKRNPIDEVEYRNVKALVIDLLQGATIVVGDQNRDYFKKAERYHTALIMLQQLAAARVGSALTIIDYNMICAQVGVDFAFLEGLYLDIFQETKESVVDEASSTKTPAPESDYENIKKLVMALRDDPIKVAAATVNEVDRQLVAEAKKYFEALAAMHYWSPLHERDPDHIANAHKVRGDYLKQLYQDLSPKRKS